jgi:hypothetical protein
MGKKARSGRKLRTKKAPPVENHVVICVNRDCKLRRKGCRGFEGCPGYMARG